MLLLLLLVLFGWRACAATAAGSYSQGWCSNVHMMLLVLDEVQRTCVVVAESYLQRLVLQQRPYAVGVAGV